MNASLQAQLEHQESLLQHPHRVRDIAELAALLAEDFVEFGASGKIWPRMQVLQALQEQRMAASPETQWQMSQVQLKYLADDLVLLTYRAQRAAAASLRSSIWRRKEQGWQMVFHQGTALPQ